MKQSQIISLSEKKDFAVDSSNLKHMLIIMKKLKTK